jgi:hypothetical protein
MERKINPYRNFEGIPRRKAPPGNHRHIRKYNIKKNLNEAVWGGLDWIGLAQHRD